MLFGFVALSAQIFSVKELPLVLVTIAMNLMPLITAIFGYVFLGEVLDTIQKLVLVFSFIGVTVMITGNTGADSNSQVQYSYYAIFILMLNPIASSAVQVTLRGLRGIGVHTQAMYHALCLTVVWATISAISGLSY